MQKRTRLGLAVLALSIPPEALSAKLDGDYVGAGNSFFEKLSFRDGGQVRITFAGMTKVGRFVVEGNEILITVGNETNVFVLDQQGCVAGGGFLGKYCKEGTPGATRKSATPSPSAAAQRRAAPSELSGVYKAGTAAMTVALDFKAQAKVRVSVSGSQAKKDSREGTYQISGDRITIHVPDGGPPLVLTRKGNTLEGAPAGEAMQLKFVKQ